MTDWVAGVDEVGRGCLFGPVFAAAVVLEEAAAAMADAQTLFSCDGRACGRGG